MRKITVKTIDKTRCNVDMGFCHTTRLLHEVQDYLGEVPPVGESREFYIVPAGQVVEFELARDKSNAIYANGKEEWFSCTEDEVHGVFRIELERGETRKVTAIIHDAEPSPELPEPPKPYERLRQGWFRHEGTTHQVQETPAGYSTVSVMPMLRDKYLWKPSELESKGIQITWYGEDA